MEQGTLARLTIEPERKATARHSRQGYRKRIFYMILLLGLGLAGYLFYSQRISGSAYAVEIGNVAAIYPSQAVALLNATGYVVPQIKADIATKATGRLEWLEVKEGSRVRKGQLIARLDNQDVLAAKEQAAAGVKVAQATLAQAETEFKDAGRALERVKNLIQKKVVTQEAYDNASARHEKALAAVNSAKATVASAEAAYHGASVAVDYTLIRAPFDGVILSKNANVGDIVAPFSSTLLSKGAVVSMADLDTLEVEADVSESDLHKVKVNQPCEIELEAIPDARFRCAVSRVVPTVDKAKATVLVKVRFVDKDSRILPNMSARVAFLSQELTPEQQQPVTVVQPAALVNRDGQQVAFRVLRNNAVSQVPVETGERFGETVEVRQGLQPGDQVVLDPPATMQDGSVIKPAQT